LAVAGKFAVTVTNCQFAVKIGITAEVTLKGIGFRVVESIVAPSFILVQVVPLSSEKEREQFEFANLDLAQNEKVFGASILGDLI